LAGVIGVWGTAVSGVFGALLAAAALASTETARTGITRRPEVPVVSTRKDSYGYCEALRTVAQDAAVGQADLAALEAALAAVHILTLQRGSTYPSRGFFAYECSASLAQRIATPCTHTQNSSLPRMSSTLMDSLSRKTRSSRVLAILSTSAITVEPGQHEREETVTSDGDGLAVANLLCQGWSTTYR